MTYNFKSIVWAASNLLLESQSGTHFQLLFGCRNLELDVVDIYKLSHLYQKCTFDSMCI
jgi:hypothetical protein